MGNRTAAEKTVCAYLGLLSSRRPTQALGAYLDVFGRGHTVHETKGVSISRSRLTR